MYPIPYAFVLWLVIRETLSVSDSLKEYDAKVCKNEASCDLVNQPNLPKNRRTFEGRNCMCDFECVKYDDCCEDSEFFRPTAKHDECSCPEEENVVGKKKHYCSPNWQIYMLNSCPAEYPYAEIASKCLASHHPLDGPDQSVIRPVTNIKKRVTYGNAYCAQCNNDFDYVNLILWNLTARCSELPSPECQHLGLDFNQHRSELLDILENVFFDHLTKTYQSQCDDKNFVCEFSTQIPNDFDLYVRKCIPNVVSCCLPSYFDQETIDKCAYSTSIVYDRVTKTPYKNKYCAKCNGISELTLTGCLAEERSTFFSK